MTETISLDDLMALIEEQITAADFKAREHLATVPNAYSKSGRGYSYPESYRHQDSYRWSIHATALRDLRALILNKVVQEEMP